MSRMRLPSTTAVAALIALGIAACGSGGDTKTVTVTAAPQTADTESGGKTVRTTINLPALVLTNLCNGDVVNLSGDLVITTTTTPDRRGGYTVRTSANAFGLQGERIAPPPATL